MRHALGQTKIENQNTVLRHHPFFSPQYWTSVPDSYKRFNSLEKFGYLKTVIVDCTKRISTNRIRLYARNDNTELCYQVLSLL